MSITPVHAITSQRSAW